MLCVSSAAYSANRSVWTLLFVVFRPLFKLIMADDINPLLGAVNDWEFQISFAIIIVLLWLCLYPLSKVQNFQNFICLSYIIIFSMVLAYLSSAFYISKKIYDGETPE